MNAKLKSDQIPEVIKTISDKFKKAEHDIYLVGGCVRDLLLSKEPKDWDFTTNARPDEIQSLFDKDETFYENDFGTVGVKVPAYFLRADTSCDNPCKNCKNVDTTCDDCDIEYEIVEITPYRVESQYSNARHPDKVDFADNLEDDLKRRDFTVNAMAYDLQNDELVDLFEGAKDLDKKVLRAVGNPKERFSEDALRILRALRLSAQLGFAIDGKTLQAMAENKDLLGKISKERIRDEFLKIIKSKEPMQALATAQQLGVLQYIVPELEEGVGCQQGKKAHKYDVFEHLLRSLQHAADKNFPLNVRLAALFHDIGKPRSRRKKGEGYTFYGHEVVGAKMVAKIMKELNMPKDLTESVVKLVRWHMFFADPDEITLSAVRRMINNVGKDEIENLLNLRMCDRIGTGRPKEQPFRFRKYKAMVDTALKDPVSVSMLKIDGQDLKELGMQPGPSMGWILHALLDEVLDDPNKNTKEYLTQKAKELMNLPDGQLKKLGLAGKQNKEEKEQEEIMKIYKKHNVK